MFTRWKDELSNKCNDIIFVVEMFVACCIALPLVIALLILATPIMCLSIFSVLTLVSIAGRLLIYILVKTMIRLYERCDL